MSDELDLMAVGDLINAAFQRLHDKIEELEAELAEANAYRAALKESKNGAIHIARKLSAELATANAKIEAVRVVHSLDGVAIRRSDGRRYCGTDWETHPCSTIRALESATPKPTDNGEDDQC